MSGPICGSVLTVPIPSGALRLGCQEDARHAGPHDYAPRAVDEPQHRTCNRHDDCDATDHRQWERDGRRATHCHDEDCEECFGQ